MISVSSRGDNYLETVRADSEPVDESKHVAANFVMRSVFIR